jgi:CBS domain-containing protein
MERAGITTREYDVLSPKMRVKDALKKMRGLDAGLLPVFEEGQVVGMLSVRDIAINVVDLGSDPKRTFVRDVMREMDGFGEKHRR